jgi:hypothetical protein
MLITMHVIAHVLYDMYLAYCCDSDTALVAYWIST